ncbi:MAG: Trm112 family protein [Rickettsiaceae bacterium]|nr:Trm112 family protein [Rickettsiaceae bacterium]
MTIELSSALVKMLSCPKTGGKLVYNRKRKVLICEEAGLEYPIVDGIPLLLESEAKEIKNQPEEV